MWKEFKEFAIKGNVVDLAVAVVIATAFGSIVSALVDNIIMPFVGVLVGGIDFSNLSYLVGDAVIQYGLFIQAIVDFFIIALALFVFVKVINRLKRKEEEVEEEVDPQVELLTEIRDLLKKEQNH
ncbi:large conductance mechanosensitive channel protein MscL [Alkalihalobacillus alcalophilus ATCC 27647 = CGMCC 1.3604]|uniref:Large-conductance mechanosensitive channel n=1 Tax=Alkalihalobacillus alcalophilus ATCC 27647 = CGMCC 1.3604 TaxID=1218173 RepID=J8TGF4_ALKAL|nr:large conductance mechanosensitive channel protein MscL [Alkalihalobacillus alcalophilus]AFV25916.1 large-conductance mechanosensitive ion channel transporter [Alkalihalobacillus alcalophilus ATCC 27647 = CGMCC 1.3604]KGA96075.1 mechanosensitive ion channel protein MscL [Alkalihalobacillus alcalophilus ATCC 27647 = CGMCC 1.3604]MED1562410.1 large conductance mechanosensitive channel protein MscL [Alkalihalobacillus alcalophilus]THG88713.1 large conductance mechanosensitive channel protein Ms